MRDFQANANLCNTLFLTRNEQVSGSSPLVGSLLFLQNVTKQKILDACSRTGGKKRLQGHHTYFLRRPCA
jgi:hypothetical protein